MGKLLTSMHHKMQFEIAFYELISTKKSPKSQEFPQKWRNMSKNSPKLEIWGKLFSKLMMHGRQEFTAFGLNIPENTKY